MISKNTVMAFLVVSAVVLGCLLLLNLVSDPSEAQAMGGATSRAGKYVVATATANEGEDLIWIVDVNLQRMIVCDRNIKSRITVLGTVDLARVFGD